MNGVVSESVDESSCRVGLAGAGSVAFGTAALLCSNGHRPMLWSPSGARTRQLASGQRLTSSGSLEGSWQVPVA